MSEKILRIKSEYLPGKDGMPGWCRWLIGDDMTQNVVTDKFLLYEASVEIVCFQQWHL